MSLGAKIALGASVVFSSTIIYFVHTQQNKDRENLKKGVIKDIERQSQKRKQNQKELDEQIQLTKVLTAQRDASRVSRSAEES